MMFAKMAENVGSAFLEKGVMLRVSKSKGWTKEKEPMNTYDVNQRYVLDKQLDNSTNTYDANQRYVLDKQLDNSTNTYDVN
jgi:hypothetical protein